MACLNRPNRILPIYSYRYCVQYLRIEVGVPVFWKSSWNKLPDFFSPFFLFSFALHKRSERTEKMSDNGEHMPASETRLTSWCNGRYERAHAARRILSYCKLSWRTFSLTSSFSGYEPKYTLLILREILRKKSIEGVNFDCSVKDDRVKKSDCLLRTNDCWVPQNTSGSRVVLIDDRKQTTRERLNLDAEFDDIKKQVEFALLSYEQ